MTKRDALRSSAHMYAYASDKHRDSPSVDTIKAKGRAGLKLELEALRYAADTLEQLCGRMLDDGDQASKVAAPRLQLREWAGLWDDIE